MARSNKSNNTDTVIKFAQSLDYDKGHSHQVTKLALNLFDELKALHSCNSHDRFLLESAALLHDIGWIDGQKAHHKTSMKLILGSDDIFLNTNDKNIVALIARYHRKALPKQNHDLFCELPPEIQRKVEILGGILRIADGLDRTHSSIVKKLFCDINNGDILIKCETTGDAFYELQAAVKKAELLKIALQKDIHFIIV
jgi:exopolyphosphatase/guanosine-5'-triphosphate,3'-diphosphate pyrophosphatase